MTVAGGVRGRSKRMTYLLWFLKLKKWGIWFLRAGLRNSTLLMWERRRNSASSMWCETLTWDCYWDGEHISRQNSGKCGFGETDGGLINWLRGCWATGPKQKGQDKVHCSPSCYAVLHEYLSMLSMWLLAVFVRVPHQRNWNPWSDQKTKFRISSIYHFNLITIVQAHIHPSSQVYISL